MLPDNLPFDAPNGLKEESTVEIPEKIKELIGRDPEIRSEWGKIVRAECGLDPLEITGEHDKDPRDQQLFEDNFDLFEETLNPDTNTSAIHEEFSMAITAATSEIIDTIPPKPLKPRELNDLFSNIYDIPESERTVWVPIEPENIDETAVGEFRRKIEGSIVRFFVEYEETLSIFSLLPNMSENGFSWYFVSTNPIDAGISKAMLEGSESQRLDSMVGPDGYNILETVPDRIRDASTLLSKHIHTKRRSPTPDGWITTLCERNGEKSELFNPRYDATFVHKETEIVLEVKPLEADKLASDENTTVDSSGVKIHFDPETVEKPTHTWELHFADDDIEEAIADSFEPEVKGDAFYEMMETINDELE